MKASFLLALSFALGIGTSATEIFVTLSPVIAEDLGLSQNALGFSFSLYFGALAASTLILTFIPIKMTMRKLLLFAVALFAFSLLITILFPNIFTCYMARLLQGFSGGILQTIAISLVKQADKNPSAHKALARQSVLSESLGMPLPIIAGLLAGFGLWQGVFAILLITVVFLGVVFGRERNDVTEASFHCEESKGFAFLKNPSFYKPAFLGAFSNGIAWAVIALLSFVIQDYYALSAFHFGIIQSIYVFLYMAGSHTAGLLPDSRASLRIGLFVNLLGIALAASYALLHSMPLLVVIGAYTYFMSGYLYPASVDLSQSAGSKELVPKVTAAFIVLRLFFSAFLTYAFSFIKGGTTAFEIALLVTFIVPFSLCLWVLKAKD